MSYIIVGIGEIVWDLLTCEQQSEKQMGGAPANFAYHSQELGSGTVSSIIVSSIGNDRLGQEISAHLDSLSLTKKYILIAPEHPTGTVLVKINRLNGNHTFEIKENVAWDYLRLTPSLRELAKKADVVCFGSLAQRSPRSRDTIKSFRQNMSASALSIFDLNLRQSYYSQEIIETSLDLANILKMNDENDLSILSQLLSLSGNDEQILPELSKLYDLKLIVLTKGEKGSILYSSKQDKFFYHSGQKIDNRKTDTVGAGDAFTASIALGLLKNYDLDYLNECANRVAAFVCTQPGATPRLTDNLKALFRK